MKLRIQTDNIGLSRKSRNAIDGHLRIALGNRSSEFQSAKIVFSTTSDSNNPIRCRISLRDVEGVSESTEETARDLDTAMEWAIWRLIHSLDRRALRTSSAPLGAPRSVGPRRR